MMTLMMAAAMPVALAGILFQEDFSNYREHAPGTALTDELSVSNDPIHRRRSSLVGAVSKDTVVFLEDKA